MGLSARVGTTRLRLLAEVPIAGLLTEFAFLIDWVICFIGDLDVQEFLRKYISKNPGPIVDIDTEEVVGEHEGLAFYTIGQREGIGIGGVAKPYYVVRKHIEGNKLFVAMGRNNPHLFSDHVKFSELHWINKKVAELSVDGLNELDLKASVRYRHKPVAGRITDQSRFNFTEAQRAITPGQSIVFYSGNICLGRAVIEY